MSVFDIAWLIGKVVMAILLLIAAVAIPILIIRSIARVYRSATALVPPSEAQRIETALNEWRSQVEFAKKHFPSMSIGNEGRCDSNSRPEYIEWETAELRNRILEQIREQL